MLSKSMLFWFATFQLLFFTPLTFATDKLAIKNFETATGFCERALQSEMPKSSGSLRVLKGNWKKYQNNMDNALNRNPSLANASNHTYTGGYFVDKTFAEIYQVCNEELPERVNEAIEYIDELRRTRQARLSQQRALLDALEQKTKLAKDYVIAAVNQHCATYVRSPSPTATNLQMSYQMAKQKALETYADIGKHFHEATMFNSDIAEDETLNKTVESWFEFCDSAFNITQVIANTSVNEQLLPPQPETVSVLPDHANLILPPLPTNLPPAQFVPPQPEMPVQPVEEPAPLDESDDEEYADTDYAADDYSEEDDPDYQEAIRTLKDDRMKVLKKEKRMPDFVDNEDFNLGASSWWRYEKDDGRRCVTYSFKLNSLIRTQEQPGECPVDY
ncbi:hypothetical protein [Candidatus Albibeggiatoa sp. nov. NOAA]|uniref:hypothetical protein n=1 Tax=Candidatus Albibeggiatoa sp. nov. NOAA TaxID=3162724 RepID=UPI0032FB2412|nr:hypothetical protein [Thiotrichaceae bacterium]